MSRQTAKQGYTYIEWCDLNGVAKVLASSTLLIITYSTLDFKKRPISKPKFLESCQNITLAWEEFRYTQTHPLKADNRHPFYLTTLKSRLTISH